MRFNFSIVRKFFALVFAPALFGVNFSIKAQTAVPERAEIFEQVWSTIDEKYCDATFNGVDWY
jgi:hypothetical protein